MTLCLAILPRFIRWDQSVRVGTDRPVDGDGVRLPQRWGQAHIREFSRHKWPNFRGQVIHVAGLAGRLWVIYAFRKKTKTGIGTRKSEIDLLRGRLARLRGELMP